MYLEILKNPIVLAVFAGSMTYLYFLWESNKKYKNLKGSKKHDKIKNSISLFIPIIVGAIVGIIAYACFSNDCDHDSLAVTDTKSTQQISQNIPVDPVIQQQQQQQQQQQMQPKFKFSSNAPNVRTMPLVGGGNPNMINNNMNNMNMGMNLDELSDSIGSASYHLISKGVNVPNKPINNMNFPDVFIETFE